jgi:O-antigen/teichoic acid export membrane protein
MSKKFLKDFSIYGIGGIISRFVGVITAPIYTRFLNTEGYGMLDLITSISAILIIFATMEMHSGYARSYFEVKKNGQLNQLRGTVMLFFVGSFLLLLLVFILLYPFLNHWIKIFEISLLIPVVLKLLPTMVITLTLLTIQFEKKPVIYSLIAIGNLVLTAGCGIFAVTYLDLGVSGILWSNAIVSFIVVFILFIVLFKYTRFNFNMTYLKETALYSVPIVPAVLGSWLNNYIGRIFIAGTLSLSMLGIYSIALKVGLLMTLAGGAFKQTWSPRANELFTQKESEPLFADVLNYYLFGFSFLLVFIITASPIIVRVLAPAEFYPAISIIGIITVGMFWDGAKNILGSGNNWVRKTYYNSIASISGGIINIFILYFFIKTGGLFIVAVGFTAGSVIQAILLLYTAQKNHFIPYSMKNLLLSLILLLSYSLLPYFSFQYFSLFSFMAIQFLVGIVILTLMFYMIMNVNERKMIIKFVGINSIFN